MKRALLVFILCISGFLSLWSQTFHGEFYTNSQDGHIYFMIAPSKDIKVTLLANTDSYNESRQVKLHSGKAYCIGPAADWKWVWKKGDQLVLVNTRDGSTHSWICEENDISLEKPVDTPAQDSTDKPARARTSQNGKSQSTKRDH